MNDDIINFPTKGTKHGADRVRNSRNDSSHVFLSVPQLVEEMIREGMTQCDSQQEQDLIELEVQELKRIKLQFLIDLILVTCEREKITLKEVCDRLESPRIGE